jgi:hypothetical protein
MREEAPNDDRSGSRSLPSRPGVVLLVLCAMIGPACSAGEVTVAAVIPVEVDDSLRSGIASTSVRIFDREGAEISVHTVPGLENLRVSDLDDGRFTFLITAHDRSGQVALEGQSAPVDVTRRGRVSTTVLLAPVEQISTLPVRGDPEAAEGIAARCGLAAARIDERADHPDVLIAGGLLDGRPTAQAWLYLPRELALERTRSMRCPRAGHDVALTRGGDRGDRVVLVAGGGSEPCADMGRTAADTLEIFDPADGRFRALDLHWMDADHSPTAPPDLSAASLATIAEELVFLAVPGSAWLLDLPAATGVKYLVSLPDDAEVDAVPLVDGESVAVLASGPSAQIDLFSASGYCNRTRDVDLEDSGNAIVGLRWERFLATSSTRWWIFDTDLCALADSWTEGALEPNRKGHTATLLRDERVLIVGGLEDDAPAPTSLFLPARSRGNPTPILRPGPVSAHAGTGHGVVSLSDGTALIVGCGAPPEIFNPRRQWQEQVGGFDRDSRPDDVPPLRVVVAVDGSEAGHFARQRATDYAPSVVSPDWGAGVVEIGVISTDLGSLEVVEPCGPTTETHFPDWVGEPEFVDPGLVDRATISDRIADIDDDEAYGPRCPVQQPLLLAGAMWDDFLALADRPFPEVLDYEGQVLVLALLGTDDRSMWRDCNPESEMPHAYCEESSWLLDPTGLAALLLDAGRGERGFELVTIWDEVNRETCPVPTRLREFCTALGPAAIYHSACTDETWDTGDFLRSRVNWRAFRQACILGGTVSVDSMECQVSASYLDGSNRNVVLLGSDEWSLERGARSCSCERWLGRDDAPPRCAEVAEGEDREYALVTITPGYLALEDEEEEEERVYEGFEYVCW